jgi:hypothetical protein
MLTRSLASVTPSTHSRHSLPATALLSPLPTPPPIARIRPPPRDFNLNFNFNFKDADVADMQQQEAAMEKRAEDKKKNAVALQERMDQVGR